MKKFLISASILSANFFYLGDEIHHILSAGCNMIHFDVMDYHYVPNLSLGPMVLESIRKNDITVPIDVHLMVSPVDPLIIPFAKAGATYITIHPETTNHLHKTLYLIKQSGCYVGIALNPSTTLDFLKFIIKDIDLILVMSVNPGFGGQIFLPGILNKIKLISCLIKKYNNKILLTVDGGINLNNISKIVRAGADIAVIGSALFKSKNYVETIKNFTQRILGV
ncbi:ribulose-phosphate 3-epimerase [Buchnera aphidicola (Cinara tujafilina)]|uniref:Ribulose-phosphate 3-epimerase n=1 Tax=Buchnera aphidicola (Cinara tujafilina) TaxID=261317 RepID=F7WZQ1_9GAMM|nr:ribulose-phosphate 3-epimerase [Buchnera aphidicola]AEH39927.1 ribulose-phosphate 3-epimerase [Buchnera aphidicola (Cinara tujafilina)]